MVGNSLNQAWLVGLVWAVLGAPVWLLLTRWVPFWLERSLGCLPSPVPVALCKTERRLDLALILAWCLISLCAAHSWGLSKAGVAAFILCGGLLSLAHIDLQTGLLPDILTLSWMWLGMLFQLSGGWISLADSVAGAALGYCVFWVIFSLYKWTTGREEMGYGDFKLSAALGAWLGVQAIPSLMLYASLAGGLTGLFLQAYCRLPVRMAIPFGPFLAVAGILILFCDYAPFR